MTIFFSEKLFMFTFYSKNLKMTTFYIRKCIKNPYTIVDENIIK